MVQDWLPGMEGEERQLDLSQYYTPPALAESLWKWTFKNHMPWGWEHAAPPVRAEQREEHGPFRVLEPAAGRGALLGYIDDSHFCQVKAYDIDPNNVAHLQSKGIDAECRDFRLVSPGSRFDYNVVIQNPPYEDDQDVDFLVHALDFAPVTTGVFRAALLNTEGRFKSLWRWHDPTRIVFLRGRPKFGGSGSPMSDFDVFEIRRRDVARRTQEAFTPISIEWW